MIKLKPFTHNLAGYGAMVESARCADLNTTTEEYAQRQRETNEEKARRYLLPLLRRLGSRSVLDVGCGLGVMVQSLLEEGFDAYGVDVPGLEKYWSRSRLAAERFFIIAPEPFALPFDDGAFDFAFSLGVIEHVGTVDGHALRRHDYHAVRKAWVREVFRTVKPGGHILMGCPNRNFPVDVAHGPDCEAGHVETWLTKLAGTTVHWPWGAHFLCGYADVRRYLQGLPHRMKPLNVYPLMGFSRVPAPLRRLARAYVRRLPAPLLDTGFNPWVMALIEKRKP